MTESKPCGISSYHFNHEWDDGRDEYWCPGVAEYCDLSADPCQRCIDMAGGFTPDPINPLCPRAVPLDVVERAADAYNKRWSYTTKDSGQREEYDSGMVRDTQEGKSRFDLVIPKGMPYDEQLLTRWANLMARGAEKYGDRNWEQGEGVAEMDRALASAFRHFMQWFTNETDEDHAAAILFNVQQVEYLKWKMRSPKKGSPKLMEER